VIDVGARRSGFSPDIPFLQPVMLVLGLEQNRKIAIGVFPGMEKLSVGFTGAMP